ncbi:MAG: tRNA (adenosine(37)-N6)-dimethylallyltransferase MiaA [Gammaproteobacteria bacterium]|nr:tRNA (adenosine(37)-N6)-dimethylallyltransferase MiaA [Gammaproteobacteria bacterium]
MPSTRGEPGAAPAQARVPPLFFLMGPTASGKTKLAITLCRHFPFEIVSVDASQVYRGMDIGTAKPDCAARASTPHHLIDIRDVCDTYSAAEFRTDALTAITDILSRGRIPLLVGGTMFYFHALEHGLSDLPSADPKVRRQITAQAQRLGWPALHARLAAIDAETASQISVNDGQRIQRALEIHTLTGASPVVLRNREVMDRLPYRVVKMAVAPQRSELHHRIDVRFRGMLANGLMDEVASVVSRQNLEEDAPALRMVGYRQVMRYLNNNIGYSAMVAQGVAATRQLAKRQLTWLRQWPGLTWFDGGSSSAERAVIDYVSSTFDVLGYTRASESAGGL